MASSCAPAERVLETLEDILPFSYRRFALVSLPLLYDRHPIVMHLRRLSWIILAALLALSACGPRESQEERHREANTPAGKVGQAAHKVAVEADKAGRAVGRSLDKAAHDAHEGWKEAERKDSASK